MIGERKKINESLNLTQKVDFLRLWRGKFINCKCTDPLELIYTLSFIKIDLFAVSAF